MRRSSWKRRLNRCGGIGGGSGARRRRIRERFAACPRIVDRLCSLELVGAEQRRRERGQGCTREQTRSAPLSSFYLALERAPRSALHSWKSPISASTARVWVLG